MSDPPEDVKRVVNASRIKENLSVEFPEEDNSLEAAREARDDAIDRVMTPNTQWKKVCEAELRRGFVGKLITGEEFRLHMQEQGIVPHHPNAWGGFISGMAKIGVLIDTGRVTQMRTARSHARRTPVWRVSGGA